jgi:hypothetical protein
MDSPNLVINYIKNTFLVVASYILYVSSQKGASSHMEDFFSVSKWLFWNRKALQQNTAAI